MDELKVGNGWRYRCLTCNYQVGIDTAFPETCPGCHAGDRWGSLATPDNGKNPKTYEEKSTSTLPIPVETHNQPTRELCKPNNTSVTPKERAFQNNPKDRGRPQTEIPEKLLKKLVDQGLGCKAITRKMVEQGVSVHYTTIYRRAKTLY